VELLPGGARLFSIADRLPHTDLATKRVSIGSRPARSDARGIRTPARRSTRAQRVATYITTCPSISSSPASGTRIWASQRLSSESTSRPDAAVAARLAMEGDTSSLECRGVGA